MECRMISQFLIAAPSSGSGKTTVSRGLMALLIKKGLKVQPFKCGPDYIDTKYHTAVCRRPSINLDTFMASAGHVKELYARYATGADACITEGMMGMYDGYDRDRGSSAEVAGLLNLPVILVVDAKSAAYSVAPLLSGFIHFRPDALYAAHSSRDQDSGCYIQSGRVSAPLRNVAGSLYRVGNYLFGVFAQTGELGTGITLSGAGFQPFERNGRTGRADRINGKVHRL